jgi:hypothetical protein
MSYRLEMKFFFILKFTDGKLIVVTTVTTITTTTAPISEGNQNTHNKEHLWCETLIRYVRRNYIGNYHTIIVTENKL